MSWHRAEFDLNDLPPKTRREIWLRCKWKPLAHPRNWLLLLGPYLLVIAVVAFLEQYFDFSRAVGAAARIGAVAAGIVWFTYTYNRLLRPHLNKMLKHYLVCTHCGYDLRQTIADGGDECPECGAAIPLSPDHPSDH